MGSAAEKALELILSGDRELCNILSVTARMSLASSLLALLIGLLTVVFQFGYQNWALDLYRGREPGYGALLDGFSIAGRLVLMEVYIAVYTTLWALAVMLPACLVIIALLPTMAAFLLLSLALPLAAQVVTAVVSYRYAMAPYRLMDHPELGPFSAIRGSVAMMRG